LTASLQLMETLALQKGPIHMNFLKRLDHFIRWRTD